MSGVHPTSQNPWSGLDAVDEVRWRFTGQGVGEVLVTDIRGGETLYEVSRAGRVPVAIELWPRLVAAVYSHACPFEMVVVGRDTANGIVWVELLPDPLEALADRLR